MAAVLIALVLLNDTRARATEAERQRAEAERLQDEARATNEANQAAILRLMNELQEVADGDLTVQATVTEDITGAIADSVNYTVEELRGLVGRVNSTAEQVSTASTQAQDISTRLLTASEAQSREIRDTGERCCRWPTAINDVSRSAGESAKVARASLDGRGARPARGAERDRGHERDPRADPGHLQAHQAAGRVVAGDRRDRRADLGHYRADQRAGAERRDPGRVRRRGGARLLGGGGRSAAAGRALGRGDQADRRADPHHPDRHAGRGDRHGEEHPGRGRGREAVRRRRHRAGRHRSRVAPACGTDRAHRRDARPRRPTPPAVLRNRSSAFSR